MEGLKKPLTSVIAAFRCGEDFALVDRRGSMLGTASVAVLLEPSDDEPLFCMTSSLEDIAAPK